MTAHINTDCLFCKMVSGAIQPDKVYEDTEVLAFRDIKPQAPVHVLIIPKRHVTTLNDFSGVDAALLGKMLLTAKHLAAQLGVAETGYRLVNNCKQDGGQTVGHVHFHLLGGRQMTWPPG